MYYGFKDAKEDVVSIKDVLNLFGLRPDSVSLWELSDILRLVKHCCRDMDKHGMQLYLDNFIQILDVPLYGCIDNKKYNDIWVGQILDGFEDTEHKSLVVPKHWKGNVKDLLLHMWADANSLTIDEARALNTGWLLNEKPDFVMELGCAQIRVPNQNILDYLKYQNNGGFKCDLKGLLRSAKFTNLRTDDTKGFVGRRDK